MSVKIAQLNEGKAVCDKELCQQARDYFAQLRKTDRLIQRLRSTVAALRSGLTGQSYDLRPDKVHTSHTDSHLEDAMVRIVDLEEQVDSRIKELVAMRHEAFLMIGNVPDFDQQNILIARYIQLKAWDDIAIELDFSTKWVLKLHGKGLLAFSRANQDFLMEWAKAASVD